MANAPVLEPRSTTPGQRPLLPPEDTFWRHYSPHNEAPLSGVASMVLHGLALLLAVLLVWVYSKLNLDEQNRSLPVEVVRLEGGGGGKPTGEGDGSGIGQEGEPEETGSQDVKNDDGPPPPPAPLKLPTAQTTRIEADYSNDPTIRRLLRESTDAARKLLSMNGEVRRRLRKNVNPGAGRGGAGSGGGKDTRKDKGDGRGQGPGHASLNQREKRMMRWNIIFNTFNGTDYLNQLHSLGAIVAFPLPGSETRYKIFRDLKNPAAAKEEDIGGINRIYWVDEKPQSVESLAKALNTETPPSFVAFFPLKLEQKLLRIELAYLQRRYSRTDENDIHETKFVAIRSGGGYDVRVQSMTLNRR